MGMTATKHFRDKLAMRQVARDGGILVPDFSPVINHQQIAEFMERVPGPWVLKPRLEAGAMGIKRVANSTELWELLNILGDQQSFRVLESYVAGDVYHVDSLTYKGKTIFNSVQKYGAPPLNVAHDGGIFSTLTLDPKSDEVKELEKLTAKVISTLGLTDGPTHAEFIKGREDGKFYFLEIAARVGGAHISDLVEMATGVNLWAEWAKIELAAIEGREYKLPKVTRRYAGLLVSLAKYEHPDLSAYNDSEVVWRMDKKNHAGLIVASKDCNRVTDLVNSYRDRFVHDFLAVAPARDKPGY
jgi:biotin carboxylase